MLDNFTDNSGIMSIFTGHQLQAPRQSFMKKDITPFADHWSTWENEQVMVIASDKKMGKS